MATDDLGGAAHEAADWAAPLDVLLADAAFGTFRRFLPSRSTLKLAAGLAQRPQVVTRRSSDLAAELGRILIGTSSTEPTKGDRRFADPAWRTNPLLRRIVQGYLAAGATAQRLVKDAQLDAQSDVKVQFLLDNMIEALAPSNSPLTNPAAIKTAVDTGGASLAHGAVNFVRDMAAPPRIPVMVDTRPFQVGENLAATSGTVVLRTEMLELIRYTPQTETVRQAPLLIIPPMINKYYAMDLAPGRSMVEYLVQQGIQVLMVSWRNPGARHADWGTDAYGQGVLAALDGAERVTGSDRSVLVGACSGGIVSAMTAAHLSATGQLDRLAGFGLLVTVLDQEQAGLASAVIDRRTARLAAAVSARKGYLDGRNLAEVFAWLRPRDLIWNYWVNNYLLGNDPPVFDILAWNADVTRMPAHLHSDFLTLGVENALVTPGKAAMLGTPVDLSSVKTDAYVVAGVADHLCDWRSCYASANLLGGRTRFVLSTSGHIAALVNPPSNPKARYQVSDEPFADPARYLKAAETQPGTWWSDFAGWLHDRCGPEVAAPTEPGGGGLAELGPAPGTYVFEH